MFIVYAPTIGYSVYNDTGRRFALSTEASRYVAALRKRGIGAWIETDKAEGR